MISECSGEDKATWRKAAAAISCQAGTPLVLRHPRTTQNSGAPPPSAIPICTHHLCYPKVHGRGKASSEGRWNPLPSSMGPMRGHHSEERQPARFSVLRRLQLHSILPSIYLNPFLTIPRFYPFTFNSNPQAILKGWAVDWCLWSGVPGARGTGRLAQGTPGCPSSALTNWLHAHGLGSGACKVKST